uniref:Uncharacterized protein n=1 Tax=Salix viminalis TaxID=40686 RepID=A0A6N2M6G8_SALVM
MNLVSMLKLFCLLSTMKNALRSCFIYYSADNEAEARIQRGALTLASAEVKFQIDTETHDPLDIATGIFLDIDFLKRLERFAFYCFTKFLQNASTFFYTKHVFGFVKVVALSTFLEFFLIIVAKISCLMVSLFMQQIREANQMVEEFMLAANVSVAEKEFLECSLLR